MAIFVARRSLFGDAIDDALAGSDGDALMPAYSAPPPSASAQTTTLGPSTSSSGQSWTNVFQNVVQSILGGGRAPSLVNRAPAPSSDNTVLVVGGLAAVGVVAYLLMRRS